MKPKHNPIGYLTVLFAGLFPVVPAYAVDYTWTGMSSNVYTNNGNWNPSTGNPGTADNVVIGVSSPFAPALTDLNRNGAGTTLINGTGSVTATGNANLDNTGSKTITDNGVLTIGSGGDQRFKNKNSFTLSGSGALNFNGSYFINGASALGNITHSGGTLTATHSRGFFLSDGASALGTTYTLSGGTMNVSSSAAYNAGNTLDRRLRSVWLGKSTESTVADPNVTGDTFKVTSGTATFTRTHATSTSDLLVSRNSSLQVEGGTVIFDKYNEVRIGYGYGGTDPNLGVTATGALNSNISVIGGTLNITGGSNVRVGFADPGTIQMSGAGVLNLTGTLNIGTGSSKGTVTMTGGTLTVTNAATDIVGGGVNANATVTLSGTSILNAATTKWKTGDFGGTGNAGTTTISLGNSAALILKEFTIGHIGSSSALETVSLADTSSLTVNTFITIGRDDNTTQSGINSFLNLNGGTLATKYIVKGADVSDALKNNVNANGGTIKALAAETDFFKLGTLNPGRVYVNLQSNGLKFDTNGFDVGIQTGLHGTGGITKQGGGTLTLSSADDYTGITAVNAGTLLLTTNNPAGGACNVADGTTLAITGASAKSRKLTHLTLGSAAGATVEIRNFDPAAGVAAIDATGSLATHGAVTLKITGTPAVGVFPLIYYPIGGSIGGDGLAAFHLATMPRGVVAGVVDNANTVSLNITALNSLIWKGNVDSNWDINSTPNWTLSGSPDKYLENDNVIFDDTSTSTNVSLIATVAPTSVTFNNTTRDYTLGGAGAITGGSTLVKTGSGALTLTSASTHTGNTTVNGGTLRFGDGATNGSITGPLVNNSDVVFNPAGSAVLSAPVSGIGNSMVKTGSGTQVLTGANTYSGVVQINGGTLQIGNGAVNGDFGTGSPYEVAAGTKLFLNYATAVPASNGWSSRVSGAGTLELNTAQAIDGSGRWGPDNAGGSPFSGLFTGTLQLDRGRFDSSPSGLGGTSRIVVNSGAQFMIWDGTYNVPVEIAGTTGSGEFGRPGGLRRAGNRTEAGVWAGPVTLTADSGISVQRNSTFDITGPITGPYVCEFYAGDSDGDSGVLNITPAAPVQNSYGTTRINGRPNASVVAGNAYAFSSGPLQVVNAILKLNGNSFSFANLSGTGGSIGNYNASGPSVLTAGADNSTTAYAGVLNDGGTAPLALVKTGTGTLSLTGANTYTGNTTVNQGVLSISTSYLADASTVSIASGAKIDLATGTAADTVGKIILGGVTVPAGTYNSSHPAYGAYFTGTGSLVVVGGYSSWAQTHITDINAGADATSGGDPDNDGTINLMEFYLNGNPLASEPAVLPAQELDATYLKILFSRRDDAETDVASQAVQFGSDLTGWTDVAIGAASSGPDVNGVLVEVTENADAPDAIVVKIPRSLAPGGRLFGRLKITK